MTEEEWLTSANAVALMCGLRAVDISWREMALFELAVLELMGVQELGSVAIDELRRTTAWVEGKPSPFSREDEDALTDETSLLCNRLESEAIEGIAELGDSHREALFGVRRVAAFQRLLYLHIGSPWRDWLPAFAEVGQEHPDNVICHALLQGYRENLSLLRCIVGNPFRPVAFLPAWRTEAAVGIAAKMYDDREFAAMPILADALEEAGCENADVLTHCREPGPHARGCWVVDGVLGKR